VCVYVSVWYVYISSIFWWIYIVRNKALCMICFNISILHPDLIWMISKLYESDWTCTRRFSDGFVTISSEGIHVKGRNFWKRFQHSFNIASTIILVINNRVMTWLQLNPRRWFIYFATFRRKMLPTNYSLVFHIDEHYFLGENIVQLYLKDISISSGTKKMHRLPRNSDVRSLKHIHIWNLHFLRLPTHYNTEIDCRVRIPSTAYERVARKWNDDVSRKDPPALSSQSTSAVRLSFGRSILVNELGG